MQRIETDEIAIGPSGGRRGAQLSSGRRAAGGDPLGRQPGSAGLEDRLGVAFVQRTTRSVHLTEAGEQLYEVVRPAVADVRTALGAVQELRTRPSGTLRLSVSSIAKTFLSGTFLAGFLAAYPDIRLDLTITDDEFDIVRQGYDAGVRLGEVIEQDMIAVPVSTEQRQFAVASKTYLSRHGVPSRPGELTGHACIGWRPQSDAAPYRWEFTENKRDFDVSVEPASPRMTWES